jgi:arylsulfatase B
VFEGGVRVPGFIWSPLLQKRGRITNQLFGNIDWLPTLYEAAGGDLADLQPHNLMGVSHWKSFQAGLSYGPRKELPVNINAPSHTQCMIYEDQYGGLYKLLQGNVFDNSFFGWFRTPGTAAGDDSWRVWTPARVNCNFPEGVEVSPCVPSQGPCLFDLTNDPCELNNIAASYPSMLALLQAKIQVYNQTYVDPHIQPIDPAADPALWDGNWVPWKDPQPLDNPIETYAPFNPSSAT